MNKKIIALVTIGLIGFSGCSTKSQNDVNPKQQLEKFKELPSWVNENKNPFVAVGSAAFRGQDYIMQRDEALTIAKSNLAHQIQAKVDVLYHSYKASIGSQNTQNDNLFRRTTSQVASRILSGVSVSKTYMSSDGELFVEIVLEPNFIKNLVPLDIDQQRVIEELKADKAFKELEVETEKFKAD